MSHKPSVARALPEGKTTINQTPRTESLALQEPCNLDLGEEFPGKSEVSLVAWWLSWNEWSLPPNTLPSGFWLCQPLSSYVQSGLVAGILQQEDHLTLQGIPFSSRHVEPLRFPDCLRGRGHGGWRAGQGGWRAGQGG